MSFTDGNPSNRPKFEDKSLKMQRAGKLKPLGDRAECCLQEMPCPPTPPDVKKYRNSILPEPGAIRVHHGKANDPDVASTLVHGIRTKRSDTIERLFHPPENSFQQKLEELNKSASRKNAQLGRSREQHGGLPAWYDEKTTFGVKTIKGQSIRELLNPPKTEEELKREAQEGHDAYIHSHSSYFVGEKMDRKYNRSHFDKDATFGLQTPHFRDGRNVGKSLRWLGEPLKFYNPNPAWERSGTEEKLAEQYGIVTRSRRKNALNLPPEHSFGNVHSPDEYGIKDILHHPEPGQEKQHNNVSAIRNQLKAINFNNFPSLLKAFQHYDKEGKGRIDRDDLRSVCREFHLNVNEVVLDGLMDLCDTDKTGLISFVAFGNFLTWKEMMPIDRRDQYLLTGEHPVDTDGKQTSAEPFSSESLIKPEDLEPIKPGSPLKTVKTIRTARTAPGHFLTSASLTVANKLLTSNSRTYGIRSEHSAPRTSKTSGTISNKCTVADLLHPSIYALHGIHEEDLRCPRTKEEIVEIFGNIPEETFEEAWKLATMNHSNGEVSIEVLCTTLKDIKAM
nr:EF-hand domain-containing family member B [Nothobranchius furzeri]